MGVGDATTVDLTVSWPSGVSQTLAAVDANQVLTIVESSTP
ncbi:MAG: ASPIC/UnbV domain-containing protein [Aureliella sp.]